MDQPLSSSDPEQHTLMIISRYKYDLAGRYFMIMLLLLVLLVALYELRNWAVLPLLFLFIPLLKYERIELDFGLRRYRVYWFRWMVKQSDFKQLPPIDHILLRDFIVSGGSDGTMIRSDNTYAYEPSLMDTDRGRLVICMRYSAKRVRNLALAIQKTSGLRLVDSTKEQLIGNTGNNITLRS